MREYRWRPLLLLAVFLVAASGCGVKGPLYLPDKQTGEPKEAPPEEEGTLEDDSLY